MTDLIDWHFDDEDLSIPNRGIPGPLPMSRAMMPPRRVAKEGSVATRKKTGKKAESYEHAGEAVLRPEVGTQAQFRKKKPSKTYRYDSSLSPALDWDGQNPARDLGEWLLAQIEEAATLGPPHLFSEAHRFGDVPDLPALGGVRLRAGA